MIEMNKELGATWEKQLNDYINDNHLLCYTLPIPGIYAITIDSHIAYINASTDTFRTGKNIIWDIMNGCYFTLGNKVNIGFLSTLMEEGHRIDVIHLDDTYGHEREEWARIWINDIKPPLNNFCDDEDDDVLLEEIKKKPVVVIKTKGEKETISIVEVD